MWQAGEERVNAKLIRGLECKKSFESTAVCPPEDRQRAELLGRLSCSGWKSA